MKVCWSAPMVAVELPSGVTWARRRAPPWGSESFLSGAITVSTPATATTWSALAIGGRAPGARTSTVTLPSVVDWPSETVTVTILRPGSEPASWKLSRPSGRTLTWSRGSLLVAPTTYRSSPSGSIQSVRMFWLTILPDCTTRVVLRLGFCRGAEFSPGGMMLRVTSAEAERPRPSSTVYLNVSEPVLSSAGR